MFTVENQHTGRAITYRRRVCNHCYGAGRLYHLFPGPAGWIPCARCTGTGTGRAVSAPLTIISLRPLARLMP